MPSSVAADPPAKGSDSVVQPDVDDEDEYEIEYEEVEEEIEVEEEVEVEEDDDDEEDLPELTPVNQIDHQNDDGDGYRLKVRKLTTTQTSILDSRKDDTDDIDVGKSPLYHSLCDHFGHRIVNCHLENKECIQCGSLEHFQKNCSRNKASASGEALQGVVIADSRKEKMMTLPTNFPVVPMARCMYCRRRGHDEANCRRKNNQCVRCGSSEHFRKDCPYQPSFRIKGNIVARSTSGTSQMSNRNEERSQMDARRQALEKEDGDIEDNAMEGKEITRDHDRVASPCDQQMSNEKTSLSGGEVNAPVLKIGFASKNADSDLYCEKETDQTPEEDSKQVASRARPRSMSPSYEFSDGSKRQAVTCEFFTKGWCVKGDSCKFLHTKDHIAVSSQQQEGILGTAASKSELPDDKASSIPHIPQTKGGERPTLKSEMQDFPLHKDDPTIIPSISFGTKSIGREFNVDHCHYPSPMAKDTLFHGMCSSSSVRSPENYGSTRISSDRAGLEGMACKRSHFLHDDYDLRVSNSYFYRSQMAFSYSSRNSDPIGPHKLLDSTQDHITLRSTCLKRSSSPFSWSESKNMSRSNILDDAQHSDVSKTKIPYNWEPSVPFRPSFLISQRLLSAASLYDPIHDSIDHTSSGDWLSKSNLSGQGASIVEAQRQSNDDPISKGSFSPDSSLNKFSIKNLSGKDSYVSATGMMESVGAQWWKRNAFLKEEKLPISDHVRNVAEPDKNRNDHDSELCSAGSIHKTEAKEERNGQKVEAAVDLKVDSYLQKDSRAFKYFHAALVEFVKELLKPTWRKGILSKDAHKSIVKKAVDKVLSTVEPQQIPSTPESVKHYLSLSEPKLAKLVEAYVDRHLKS